MRTNETVQSKSLCENEDKDHADKELGLLSVGPARALGVSSDNHIDRDHGKPDSTMAHDKLPVCAVAGLHQSVAWLQEQACSVVSRILFC